MRQIATAAGLNLGTTIAIEATGDVPTDTVTIKLVRYTRTPPHQEVVREWLCERGVFRANYSHALTLMAVLAVADE